MIESPAFSGKPGFWPDGENQGMWAGEPRRCIINPTAAAFDFIKKEAKDEIQTNLAFCFLRSFLDINDGLLCYRQSPPAAAEQPAK